MNRKRYNPNELTELQEQFLSRATEILNARESNPGHPYWLCGDGDDEGISYCYDCITQIRADDFEQGDTICGGYPGYSESDSPEICEKCGKLLSYTLTDYGVNSELEHFLDPESTWDWNNAYECFELNRIVHGLSTTDQKRRVIKALRKGKNRPMKLSIRQEVNA